jgi:RNA polymerase sigma factor (sigma-70 family)
MKLDDKKVKILLKEYSKDEQKAKELKNELSTYIYYFPKLAYKRDFDFCGDFYLYVIERIESILKNFPPDADVKFQTWFNYVLKNQYLNFLRFKREENFVKLSFDDYKDEIFIDFFDEPEMEEKKIFKVFENIDGVDRAILKLYYIPEMLENTDLKLISKYFSMSVSDVLELQRKIINHQKSEFQKVKELSSKVKEINSIIVELKYKLYKDSSRLDEKNEIMLKIARLEAKRFKIVKKIVSLNDGVFQAFSTIFDSRKKAQYRLKIAREKFRFYFLKLKKEGLIE